MYDLSSANTLALSSSAQQVFSFKNEAQLPELLTALSPYTTKHILGGGSNVVLAPQLLAPVVRMQNKGIRCVQSSDDFVIIEAQAGENWHDFVQYCVQKGWWGLENLALIPGTVGAAPVQNIGAYGVELQQRLHSIRAWDFEHARWQVFSAEHCEFAYRHSRFKAAPGRYLIVAVQFKLDTPVVWQPITHYPDLDNYFSHQGLSSAAQVFEAVVAIRQRKLPDPLQLPNAGSFFKNPVVSRAHYKQLKQQYPCLVAYAYGQDKYKLAAGWLIDQLGWKGRRLGPVGMHKNQALVLVNYGQATAKEVIALAQCIQTEVQQHFGVRLEPEPIYMA